MEKMKSGNGYNEISAFRHKLLPLLEDCGTVEGNWIRNQKYIWPIIHLVEWRYVFIGNTRSLREGSVFSRVSLFTERKRLPCDRTHGTPPPGSSPAPQPVQTCLFGTWGPTQPPDLLASGRLAFDYKAFLSVNLCEWGWYFNFTFEEMVNNLNIVYNFLNRTGKKLWSCMKRKVFTLVRHLHNFSLYYFSWSWLDGEETLFWCRFYGTRWQIYYILRLIRQSPYSETKSLKQGALRKEVPLHWN